MHSFNELLEQFSDFFNTQKFPASPAGLYEPCDYFWESVESVSGRSAA